MAFLELPRRVELLAYQSAWVFGVATFTLVLCLLFDRSPMLVLYTFLVAWPMSSFTGIPLCSSLDRTVLPLAVAELRRAPNAKLPTGGIYWPRQSWYLPYSSAAIIGSMMVFVGVVAASQWERVVRAAAESLVAGQDTAAAFAVMYSELLAPLTVIGLWTLAVACVASWSIGARQREGSRAIHASIEALAAGAPAPPAWIGTDELGDLARHTAGISSDMRVVLDRIERGDLSAMAEERSGLLSFFRRSQLAQARLADAMVRLSRGEVSDAETLGGDLGRSFGQLNDALRETILQARTIAEGDLRRDMEVEGPLGEAVQRMTRRLRDAVGQMQGTGGELEAIVAALHSAAAQLSAATAEQVAALTETSATATEMSQTSAVSAERAAELIRSGERAAELVEEGGRAAKTAIDAMAAISASFGKVSAASRELAERVQRIDRIIETVGFLADQSSTLAINAAIEAARAGEAGKGFAAVAREVRALAHDSRQATAEVREILGEIRQRSQAVEALVSAGSGTAEDGSRQVARMELAVSGLGKASQDSVQLMRQVEASARQNQAGVGQILQAISSTQAAAESVRDGAQSLSANAGKAREMSEALKRTSDAYKLSAGEAPPRST